MKYHANIRFEFVETLYNLYAPHLCATMYYVSKTIFIANMQNGIKVK